MNTSMMIEVMHGFGKIGDYSRNSGCGYECGRKTFRWDNGPQGFGDGSPAGKSTQWPSSLNMGATFDPELAGQWGLAMGLEFWTKGTNIQEVRSSLSIDMSRASPVRLNLGYPHAWRY